MYNVRLVSGPTQRTSRNTLMTETRFEISGTFVVTADFSALVASERSLLNLPFKDLYVKKLAIDDLFNQDLLSNRISLYADFAKNENPLFPPSFLGSTSLSHTFQDQPFAPFFPGVVWSEKSKFYTQHCCYTDILFTSSSTLFCGQDVLVTVNSVTQWGYPYPKAPSPTVIPKATFGFSTLAQCRQNFGEYSMPSQLFYTFTSGFHSGLSRQSFYKHFYTCFQQVFQPILLPLLGRDLGSFLFHVMRSVFEQIASIDYEFQNTYVEFL